MPLEERTSCRLSEALCVGPRPARESATPLVVVSGAGVPGRTLELVARGVGRGKRVPVVSKETVAELCARP